MPWLHGADARNVMWPAGALRQPSLRLITPPALVMISAPTGFSGNRGMGGGASTGLAPSLASEQLILVNNRKPVGGLDGIMPGTVWQVFAAARQAFWSCSVKLRHRAAMLTKARRILIWASVRGSRGTT